MALVGTGDVAGGRTMVLDGLRAANEHHLLYETYLCLTALLEIEGGGGPAAPEGTQAERDAIVAALGIVTRR
jgi:hypothetical protein